MRKIQIFISLMLFSLIISCSSTYVIKDPIDFSQYVSDTENSNLVVTTQSQLVIPDGWQFQKSDTKDETIGDVRRSTLFEFNDRQNNIYGKFNYTAIVSGSLVDPAQLVKILAESRDDISNKAIMKTFINRKESYIITGTHKNNSWDYMAAIIPEGNSFNEIVLLSDPGYLQANPSVAYRIFNSYSFSNKGVNERIIRGSIKFKSDDGAWYWYNDWTTKDFAGYFVMDSSDHETPIEFIGIATLDSSNMETIKSLISGFNEKVIVSEYDVDLKVANKQVSGKAIASKSGTDMISIYYVVKLNKKTHLIMVCYKDGVVDIKPEKIHSDWKLVNTTINKYLYL